eukprot:TRINITY_DN7543_c0_g3_i1.p1 TRINITY_DN7543_c0_g3~~TRINITY_DN7543_c0_g3_i1.p1  ORF type:complete len:460 (+),score=109.40 TRINITY_DN7543_c0_g3_i1:95-1474(+)
MLNALIQIPHKATIAVLVVFAIVLMQHARDVVLVEFSDPLSPTVQTQLNGKGGFSLIQNLYIDAKNQRWIYGNIDSELCKKYAWDAVPGMTAQDKTGPPHPIWTAECFTLNPDIHEYIVDGLVLVWNENMVDVMMAHYFHFMEFLEAIWACIHEFEMQDKKVEYIVFTYSGEEHWRGKIPYINEQILHVLWPNAVILSDEKFISFFSEKVSSTVYTQSLVTFRNVIVVDRRGAHHNTLSNQLNKMDGAIYQEVKRNHQSLREKVLIGMKAQSESPPEKVLQKLLIVDRYEDRPGRRSMNRTILTELIGALNATEKFDLEIAQFEKMSFLDQMRSVQDADVIMGVHGNGLTHVLWMKPGSTLVEIFPAGMFVTDFEFYSEFAGLKHFAWDCKSGFIAESIDVVDLAGKYETRGHDHTGDNVEVLDVAAFVTDLVLVADSSDWETTKSTLRSKHPRQDSSP